MQKQVILTAQGLKQITDELEDLKSLKREEVAEKIKQARSFGDLSENSEYDEAKNEQAMVESRIAELENMLKVAVVLNKDQIQRDVVSLGTSVKVKIMEDGTEETALFQIVGSETYLAMQCPYQDLPYINPELKVSHQHEKRVQLI